MRQDWRNGDSAAAYMILGPYVIVGPYVILGPYMILGSFLTEGAPKRYRTLQFDTESMQIVACSRFCIDYKEKWCVLH